MSFTPCSFLLSLSYYPITCPMPHLHSTKRESAILIIIQFSWGYSAQQEHGRSGIYALVQTLIYSIKYFATVIREVDQVCVSLIDQYPRPLLQQKPSYSWVVWWNTINFIDWFECHVKLSRVILCLEVWESKSLNIHIYIFVSLFLQKLFTRSYQMRIIVIQIFLHDPIKCE